MRNRMRKPRGGVSIDVDVSAVAEGMGLLEGMVSATRSRRYMGKLLDGAIANANEQFNIRTASMGQTGQFKHMFEWGTLGINRKATNIRPSPMTERARLWKLSSVGTGVSRSVNFEYKPSIGLVPNPTRGRTNMSTDVIGMLKRHVFYNKAMVMETGMQVTIKRKRGTKFLLIPIPRGSGYGRKHDRRRGYWLHKGPLYARPGQDAGTAGSFTNWWNQYWGSEAPITMDREMDTNLKADMASIPMPVKARGHYRMTTAQYNAMLKSAEARARGMMNARR